MQSSIPIQPQQTPTSAPTTIPTPVPTRVHLSPTHSILHIAPSFYSAGGVVDLIFFASTYNVCTFKGYLHSKMLFAYCYLTSLCRIMYAQSLNTRKLFSDLSLKGDTFSVLNFNIAFGVLCKLSFCLHSVFITNTCPMCFHPCNCEAV